jgi:hypothetical protein
MDGHPAVRSALGALLLVALFPAREAAARASEPPAPAPATLADVAFMAGHWTGGEDGDLSEEIWSTAHGVEGTVRLTYRKEAKGGLVSVLEKKGSRQEFRFRKR